MRWSASRSSIVLNITDIANFAQGEMAMLTTFFAYWLLESLGLPWWQATPLALLFGLVQGIVIQQVVIRPLIGAPYLSAIIATLGLNIVLNSLAGMIWGHETYTFPSPFAFSAPFVSARCQCRSRAWSISARRWSSSSG